LVSPRKQTIVIAVVAVLVVVATIVLVVVTRSGDESPTAAVTAAAQKELFDRRGGFGRDVTGGAGGKTVHVTKAADSGSGSLRAALEGDDPSWVVFDADFKIQLKSGIEVGSNKTIDGRGHRVTITGHGTDGLIIREVSNIIVENVTLTDFGDTSQTKKNNKPDAIHIQRAHNVWIDHNDLSLAGDKLISIDDGATGVTVSWNHFHDQEQVFQIGSQATATGAAEQTVTVDHNYFDGTGYRNPVVSYGKVHVYNNFMRDWKLFGVRVERTGQVYLENNVMEAGRNRRAALTTARGNGCNDAKTRCDNRAGYLRAVGNLTQNGAVIRTNGPQLVFAPAALYSYQAVPATPVLATEITSGAGWQERPDPVATPGASPAP
jgi:pectate lyase